MSTNRYVQGQGRVTYSKETIATHHVYKEKISPEELMRLKFQAKCRFRAIVRRVMANKYWLMQMDDEEYEGDNVKRRVVQAMRTKSKKNKAWFSLKDKALLNKPVSERTESEKHYLYRKIGGLKCFKRYPNHVKKKLAAVTNFVYYGPNRVIVRQNQEAHALYFVITGEVIVSILVFDELLKQYNSVNVFVMHPGDMFGEVSLLHNIKRTATCTTSGHCEFLALLKDDFKHILQDSLMQQWNHVLNAMSRFSYFDNLDEVARREACIVAKMKSYAPNETILGDGLGLANFVYFVLSGNCQMIETLKIGITRIHNKTSYSLIEPFELKNDSETDLTKKYFERTITESGDKDAGVKESYASSKQELSKEKAGQTAVLIDDNANLENTKKRHSYFQDTDNSTINSELQKQIDDLNKILPEKTDKKRVSGSSKKSQLTTELDGLNVVKAVSEREMRASVRFSTEETKTLLADHKTYFMQVCIFRPGSTFGFGENMRDRRIVSLTHVDCMLLPKMWLLQRNTTDIWSRIQHYLEKKIPTKKQLFHEFVNQRKWEQVREKIVQEVVQRNKSINFTTVHDVPYSIRMQEMHDI